MEFPGKKVTELILNELKREIRRLKKKTPLKLAVFQVGESPDQLSFIRMKSELGNKLGIKCDLAYLKNIPTYEQFMGLLKEKYQDPEITGLIIQQPVPAQLSTSSFYDYIPNEKEIEGHKKKSYFVAPIGLAVLTVFKYVFGKGKVDRSLLVNFEKDRPFFKRTFRNKKVVLVGRGITGGSPIGRTLSEMKINYFSVGSTTPEPEVYIKEADVVITAVGKKIIDPVLLKRGVVLINVGLRRENGKLRGDYEESEIRDIASFYTSTPGGIGPIDVLYLFRNLIEAARIQKKRKVS